MPAGSFKLRSRPADPNPSSALFAHLKISGQRINEAGLIAGRTFLPEQLHGTDPLPNSKNIQPTDISFANLHAAFKKRRLIIADSDRVWHESKMSKAIIDDDETLQSILRAASYHNEKEVVFIVTGGQDEDIFCGQSQPQTLYLNG